MIFDFRVNIWGDDLRLKIAKTEVIILAALDVGFTFYFSGKGTAVASQLLTKCEDSAGGTVRCHLQQGLFEGQNYAEGNSTSLNEFTLP